MTTYTQENRRFLKGQSYSNLLNAYKRIFGCDKLIKELDSTINGRKILERFIIKQFENEKNFTIAELETIFFEYKGA